MTEAIRFRKVSAITYNPIQVLTASHTSVQSMINSNIEKIAEVSEAYWKKLVQDGFKSDRERSIYWDAVNIRTESGPQMGIKQILLTFGDPTQVMMSRSFAQKMEFGSGPYDLKPGLLKGKSAKIGKHGVYAVIPIEIGGGNWRDKKFGVTGATGIFQADQPIAALMRNVRMKPIGSVIRSKDHPIVKDPAYFPMNKASGAKAVFSRYERLTRTIGGWKIYRTVHEKHKMSGKGIQTGEKWVHPGFKGKKFMDQVVSWANKNVATSFVSVSRVTV